MVLQGIPVIPLIKELGFYYELWHFKIFGNQGMDNQGIKGRFRFEILAKRWRYQNSVGKLLESSLEDLEPCTMLMSITWRFQKCY